MPEGYTIEFDFYAYVEVCGNFKFAPENIVVYNENGIDVTQDYYIKVYPAYIDVLEIEIEISTGSAEKYYDGTALTSSVYWISSGELLEGHVAQVVTKGSIVDPGEAYNEIESVVIYDTFGNDVSEYYKILHSKDTYGILVVK